MSNAARGYQRGVLLIAGLLLALAAAPGSADGQHPANISDVTGPITTSGDMVVGILRADREAGYEFASAIAAEAASAAAHEVLVRLRTGSISVPNGPGDMRTALEVPDHVADLLTGNQDAVLPFRSAMVEANEDAAAATDELLVHLLGLAAALESIGTPQSTRAAATQLAKVIVTFNALVLASDDGFLRNPPSEFRALRWALSTIVQAAAS